MRRTRQVRWVAGALFCAILGTWLTSGEAQTSTKPPVKFGLLVSKTQKGIAWGRKQEIAAQMAVAEIDKAGGINGSKIDLVIYDTAGENQQAVILTRKLATEDKVVAILGPVFSAEAAVAFAQAKQLEVPIISGSAAMPGLAGKNKPWAFTAQATDYKVQLIVSKRFVETYKVKRVAMLQDTKDGWSKFVVKPMVESMTAAGATVINAEAPITFQTGDTDFSVQVTKLKSLNPDAVVFAGLYTEAAGIAREMKRQRVGIPAVGGMGMTDPQLIEQGQDSVEGWMVPTTFWPDAPDTKVRAFTATVTERAKTAVPDSPVPDKNVANMYDVVHITAKILRDAGMDGGTSLRDARAAIQKGWAGLRAYTGISGTLSMDPEHEADRSVLVLVVKDGRFVPAQ